MVYVNSKQTIKITLNYIIGAFNKKYFEFYNNRLN